MGSKPTLRLLNLVDKDFGEIHISRPRWAMNREVTMLICDAIRDKRLLQFQYHGYLRIVQPATYGLDENGRKTLRAYQIRGKSSTGHLPKWRVFHESDMSDLSVLDESFCEEPPEYIRDDHWFFSIRCQL